MGKNKISKLIGIPDFLTLTNLTLGFLAIIFSFRGYFLLAALLIISAVFFDWIDGKVARKLKKTHELGKELDSLADLVSFGVAPAIFTLSLVKFNVLNMALLAFFVCCGALRLARFNITHPKYYEGLPITFNGMLVPVLFFLKAPHYLFPYILLISGILMVSTIRAKKVI